MKVLIKSLLATSVLRNHKDKSNHNTCFKGDVAMFHSWKRSFKAMMRDADIATEQEHDYHRSFTSDNPQELVNNYRKRQGDSPTITLSDLWVELPRRFGNSAALTQALMKRLSVAAGSGEKDSTKLQKLAEQKRFLVPNNTPRNRIKIKVL